MITGFSAVAQTKPASTDSSISKFDRFNKKMERLFKIIPVPIFSYSSDAGNIFGLAKYNLFQLSKKDTVSSPSKISAVVSFSTKGRVNISVANELLFNQNKYLVKSFVNYKKQPEFIFGIGNDVKAENAEQINQERFVFSSTTLRQIKDKFYAGVIFNVADYFNIKVDSNSYLIKNNVSGLNGGVNVGVGIEALYDSRDNRYNPSKGFYLEAGGLYNFGAYGYSRALLDARKYFTPFKNKIVVAVQATTTSAAGNVPFYDLSMLGSDNRMRGYYQGALRDNVAIDAQAEIRIPVWSIFGITGFIGTGQVASSYGKVATNGFWLSYGGGLRIKVDSKNNTNLRVDFGFGPHGISATYINFAEAF